MKQTRIVSLLEAFSNVAIGYRSPIEAFLSELGKDGEIRFARTVALRAGIYPLA